MKYPIRHPIAHVDLLCPRCGFKGTKPYGATGATCPSCDHSWQIGAAA